MSDLIFCQNCQQAHAVTDDFSCCFCGENICTICGCTDSEPCAENCEWVRPGLCSECADSANELQLNSPQGANL